MFSLSSGEANTNLIFQPQLLHPSQSITENCIWDLRFTEDLYVLIDFWIARSEHKPLFFSTPSFFTQAKHMVKKCIWHLGFTEHNLYIGCSSSGWQEAITDHYFVPPSFFSPANHLVNKHAFKIWDTPNNYMCFHWVLDCKKRTRTISFLILAASTKQGSVKQNAFEI